MTGLDDARSADDAGSRRLPTGWRRWVAGARPRTWPAAIVPVLVGTACAAGMPHRLSDGSLLVAGWVWTSDPLNHGGLPVGVGPADLTGPLKGIVLWRMVAAMVVALAIQIGTNYANDYSDGRRGTDDPGQRTGPVRLVGWGLAEPRQVKAAALVSFAVAGLAGLTLAAAVGWWLVGVGLVCLAAGWFYTGGRHPYGYYGFGELFVFVFFGLVATIGSAYVQTGTFSFGDGLIDRIVAGDPNGYSAWVLGVERYPWVTALSAAAVGGFATALLVVNNLRDIPGDTRSGKKTLAVRLGDRRTRVLYVVLMVMPFVLVPLIAGGGYRLTAVAALLVVLAAQRPVLCVLRGDRGPALVPVLAATGQVQLLYGLVLAAGLFVSAPGR